MDAFLKPDATAAERAALSEMDYQRLLALGGQPLTLRGINIQRPWSQLILAGKKTIEARKYALKNYQDEDLWIIETKGNTRAAADVCGAMGLASPKNVRRLRRQVPYRCRIVGVVRFSSCFRYTDLAQWRADEDRHRISTGSLFDWQGSGMYGWHIAAARALAEPQQGPAEKGLIGCKAITRVALWSQLASEGG